MVTNTYIHFNTEVKYYFYISIVELNSINQKWFIIDESWNAS